MTEDENEEREPELIRRVIVNFDDMDTMDLWSHNMLMAKRIETVGCFAEDQGVDLSFDVCNLIAVIRVESGRFLGKEEMEKLVLEVISFSKANGRKITYGLVNEVYYLAEKKQPDPFSDGQKYSHMFDPKSALELEAFQMYEAKYGHIPVRDLTEEDAEEHKKFYFECLEKLKERRIKK